MIIQQTKYVASMLVAYMAGVGSTLIFTRLFKWSVVILILGALAFFAVWWIKRKLTKTNEKEVVQ